MSASQRSHITAPLSSPKRPSPPPACLSPTVRQPMQLLHLRACPAASCPRSVGSDCIQSNPRNLRACSGSPEKSQRGMCCACFCVHECLASCGRTVGSDCDEAILGERRQACSFSCSQKLMCHVCICFHHFGAGC